MQLASVGVFILPQTSTPFKFSGETSLRKIEPMKKLQKFLEETSYKMEICGSIDTAYYLNDWNGVSPLCEIVEIDKNK